MSKIPLTGGVYGADEVGYGARGTGGILQLEEGKIFSV